MSLLPRRRRWIGKVLQPWPAQRYRVQINITQPGPDNTDFTFLIMPGERQRVTIVGYRQDDTGWHVINVPIDVMVHVT